METNQIPAYLHIISDVEVEKNVLGSMLMYARCFNEVRELLSVECFSLPLHQDVYAAIVSLADKGEPIDTLTASTELSRMGKAVDLTLYHLTEMGNASSSLYYYNALVLAEFRSRNKAWLLAQMLLSKAKDMTYDLTDSVEEATAALSGVFAIPSSGITGMKEAARLLYVDHIDRNLAGGTSLTGTPTGFREFDLRSGGLQKGNFLVIAGETSQGKTSLAMSMVLSAAQAGYPVAYYSMEMTVTELFARMAACHTGVPASRYLYGQLCAEELKEYDRSVPMLAGLPVYFDDKSTSNIDVIIASIRVMVARKGIKGAVVDYLQILNVNMKGSNKEQQMGEVARRLKNLAKDLGIWIIALSQLRRDDSSHVPTLNRLRDSGQIAEAADTVMLLYRPEVYGLSYPEPFRAASTRKTALIDVAKGRNIGLSKCLVGFDASVTRFYELEQVPGAERDDDDSPF